MPANRATIAWHLENQVPRGDQRAIGMVYEKIVELTSAEILALFTTTKELVAAPGVGKVLEFMSATFFIDYNTATYATRGDLTVNLATTGTAVSNTLDAADLVQKTADTYVLLPVKDTEETVLQDNEALELRCATGNPVTGDSTIKVSILYRIHDFNAKHPRFDN